MANGTQSIFKHISEWLTFERVWRMLVLVLLALLVFVIWQSGLQDIFSQDGSERLLTKLSQVDFGRFMITCFVVAIVVIIAANMTWALFRPKSDSDLPLDKRFALGRELLTVFIGLLGTLMGFYFAENRVSPESAQKIANIAQNPPASAPVQLETKAFDYLIKQDYDLALKAFDDVSKATPPSSNIANITAILKYLSDNKAAFTGPGDKKPAWKDLYCYISNGGMAVGQSKEVIDKFTSGCNPPPVVNANLPVRPAATAPPANLANVPANTRPTR